MKDGSTPANIDALAEQDLLEFAARYTAAWCSQDAGSVAMFFSPEGRLAINGGTPSIGRKAITTAPQNFMTAFPDLLVTMDRLAVEHGRVKYFWTLTGNNTGPGGSGRKISISGQESWRFSNDGLIAESAGQFDETEYNRQLWGT